MLEQCANSLSVMMVTPRAILSPEPYLAFEWETEEEKEYLLGAAGFAVRQSMSIKTELAIAMCMENIELLGGRQDGAALLAEALSQSHALGKFREYMRLFELAFASPVSHLAKKLAQFLGSGEAGYTVGEVRQWIELRNPATHAQDGTFVTEAAARHFIARIEQAAYDVLYNKDEWRNSSRIRRDAFRPTTWTTSTDGTIAVEQGSIAHVRAELLDGFLAYPLDRNFQIVLGEKCWSEAVVQNYGQALHGAAFSSSDA